MAEARFDWVVFLWACWVFRWVCLWESSFLEVVKDGSNTCRELSCQCNYSWAVIYPACLITSCSILTACWHVTQNLMASPCASCLKKPNQYTSEELSWMCFGWCLFLLYCHMETDFLLSTSSGQLVSIPCWDLSQLSVAWCLCFDCFKREQRLLQELRYVNWWTYFAFNLMTYSLQD